MGAGPSGVAMGWAWTPSYVADVNGDALSVVNGRTSSHADHAGRHRRGLGGHRRGNRHRGRADGAANTVLAINERTNKVTATIPVGNEPFILAVNDETDTIYAANHADNTISVIDGRTNEVKTTVPVGAGPFGVMADPVSGTVYVGNFADDPVSVIDGRTNQVEATIPVGAGPFRGLAAAGALTRNVYVSNADGNTVQPVRGVQIGRTLRPPRRRAVPRSLGGRPATVRVPTMRP